MADVTIEQIVSSAWASAGISAPLSDVQHVLRLINGEGKKKPCLLVMLFVLQL